MLTLKQVIIGILLLGFLTFLARFLPFWFYARRRPSRHVMFIQRYIPPMAMTILLFYSISGVSWGDFNQALPVVCGIFLAVVSHMWLNNALLSIFGATALYMFLSRIL